MDRDYAETLARIESKLDQVLIFRDQVLAFASAGAAKKLAMLARTRKEEPCPPRQ